MRCRSCAGPSPTSRSPGSQRNCPGSSMPIASIIWRAFAAPDWNRNYGAAGPELLLLLPERQKPLRRRTSDHAGNADRNLPQRRGRDAPERNRSDADLAPETQVAPAIGAFGLEFLHRAKRILAQRRNLYRVGRLDHLAERRLDRGRLVGKLAAEIFTQAGVADRIARQRIARHAADRQLVDGVAALAPRQHLNDALDRRIRAGGEIVYPQRIQKILVARKRHRDVQLVLVLGKGIFGEGTAQLVHHTVLYFFQRNVGQGRELACEVGVYHHAPSRHSRRYPSQDVSP